VSASSSTVPRDRPVSSRRAGGFSLVELLIAIAACGVLIAVSIPLVLSYHQSAQVTAGGQHVRTLLNPARQLAMNQKGFVCVHLPNPTQMSFYSNSACTGTPWTGTITDAAGHVNLEPGFTLAATADPVFDYLGRALPAATYTITNATTGSTVTVSVYTSGRITIP
jgi:prepilin-type N-terminal cleavage/methylation domain-containing protein